MSMPPTAPPRPARAADAPSALEALSPLDGRYAGRLAGMRLAFSEAALIRERVRVEASWFLHLKHVAKLPELAGVTASVGAALDNLMAATADGEAAAVKALEATTNHDVKAVEYYVRGVLKAAGATTAELEFVHFACTSEDINNLAYAQMARRAREHVLVPAVRRILATLESMAREHAALPMLSRTHGQAASPTTLGKELANVACRVRTQLDGFGSVPILGKMNGAVGNWNAHVAAAPEVDWREVSAAFVTAQGLGYSEYSTQIECHDWIAEYLDALSRLCIVLIDFCRDVWGYVSVGYFRQRVVAGEVGSSTMPHKVNPIDFENAEGNLGIAEALCAHFARKLPVSRWQRDLTDSTVLRNLGVALGHFTLAVDSIGRGLARLEADEVRLAQDLEANWEVLGEAVQTVMRRHGVADAYEQLKALTRGKRLSPDELRTFIATLSIPEDARARLAALTPHAYTGLAAELARDLPGDRH
jgi:adenylosuccinate lyase